MKPSQLTEIGSREQRISRRFPITHYNYQSVGFHGFNTHCTGTSRSSFAEISRDYFKAEARRGFVIEAVLFVVITATALPAILDCGRALLGFLRATNGM